MKKKFASAFLCFVFSCILTQTCNKETDNPISHTVKSPLVLVVPTGGESYKVGQTIRVQWQVNDATKIASVMVYLSLDAGRTYPVTLGGHSFGTDTTWYDWTISSSCASSQCMVMVREYNDLTIKDKSSLFSIVQ